MNRFLLDHRQFLSFGPILGALHFFPIFRIRRCHLQLVIINQQISRLLFVNIHALTANAENVIQWFFLKKAKEKCKQLARKRRTLTV